MERPRFDQTWSPVENLPPREQVIERVVGGLTAAPEAASELKERLRDEVFDEALEFEGELEKTPEEVEVMNEVLVAMPAFIERYGGRPVPFTADRVFLINRADLSDAEREALGDDAGYFDAPRQFVKIFLSNASGDLPMVVLRHHVGHELLHGNSFHSVEAKDDDTLNLRRGGSSCGPRRVMSVDG